MTPQEREQLSQFIAQLTHAQIGEKDPQADAMIKDACIKQPDAAYLLVQRALLLEQALNGAKAQIAQLQNQLQSNNSRSSFLGSNDPWAQPAQPVQQPVPGIGNYQPQRAAPAQPSSFMNPMGGAGSTGSSFLGNIATTAAGVVAGSFLFQGIENLMGHHGSSWGGPSGWGGQPNENFTENTTINNYYESDRDSNLAQSDDNFSNASYDDSDDYSSNDGDDSSWI